MAEEHVEGFVSCNPPVLNYKEKYCWEPVFESVQSGKSGAMCKEYGTVEEANLARTSAVNYAKKNRLPVVAVRRKTSLYLIRKDR